MFSIKIDNLDEIQRAFKEAPHKVDRILQTATKKAGAKILATEKKEVPVKSADLRKSISMEYTPIQVTVRPNKEYAIYVHEGTGIYGKNKRPITPKNKPYLVFKINGKWIRTKKVMGQKPNPFVQRTAEKSERPVNSIFDKALKEIIKKI